MKIKVIITTNIVDANIRMGAYSFSPVCDGSEVDAVYDNTNKGIIKRERERKKERKKERERERERYNGS